MRIALDARTLYRPNRRGTGKNLLDLYRHLARLRPGWSVAAYHRSEGAVEPLLPSRWASERCLEMPGDRLGAWERIRLPLAAWRGGADILHCPANTCPEWMPVRTVVTIHDLIPLDRPDERSAADLKRFEHSIRAACRRAAWILTPSRCTRDRLVSEFHADASRITVNPWAPDSSVSRVPCEMWPPVLDRYGIRSPFVLHLGAPDPRKNTMGVIEAWSRLDAELRGQWRLLVVGLDGASRDRFASYAALRGVASGVVLRGFAEESDLPTLLSAAEALVFPSLAEGFGLPILDAWAAQTPVLTSTTTSLPEVAGDAALLVDPGDVTQIAAGLTRLLTDDALRAGLVSLGSQRLRDYSWGNTAERFARALEAAVGLSRTDKAAA